MEETGKENLFFVYCDIFESIDGYFSSSLGLPLGEVVNNITIVDNIKEILDIDAPKDIARLLDEIKEIIEKIREIYHTSSARKKILEKELRKIREDVRDYIGKIERRIGKIEYLIEFKEREERMALRSMVKELQGIKKTIKEFTDGLGALETIEWDSGLSKANITIKPKSMQRFYLAKTKLFEISIDSPSNVLISIEKGKVILSTDEGLLFDFFPLPSMSHIVIKEIVVSKEDIKMEGFQEEKEFHVKVRREGKDIHINFSGDGKKISWKYPVS